MAMVELLLDTGAWIEIASGRRQVPARFAGATMVVCTLAIAELASISEQGRTPKDSVARMLVEARLEEPSVVDMVEGGFLHGRRRLAGDRKVSVIDCVMYCTARRLGLPFLTSDHDLRDQSGVHLL